MEKPYLNDADVYPDDKVLGQLLGPVMPVWTDFLNEVERDYPGAEGEWRYYKDGGSWLFKVVKKKKTLCWGSVYPEKFKITFYFPDRAEDPICQSALDPEFIEQFVHGKHYGKTRGLTIEVTDAAAIDPIRILLAIKDKLK